MFPPRRIVCLTEETVETLLLLGEEDRIVGISSYVVAHYRLAARSRAWAPSRRRIWRMYAAAWPPRVVWTTGSGGRQAHLNVRAFLLKREKDRGIEVCPAA